MIRFHIGVSVNPVAGIFPSVGASTNPLNSYPSYDEVSVGISAQYLTSSSMSFPLGSWYVKL